MGREQPALKEWWKQGNPPGAFDNEMTMAWTETVEVVGSQPYHESREFANGLDVAWETKRNVNDTEDSDQSKWKDRGAIY